MEVHYEQHSVRSRKIKKPFWIRLGAVAACLAIVIAVGGILAPFLAA